MAGLVGVTQSDEDKGIRPIAGWAIARPTGIDVLIDRLRRNGCTAPVGIETKEMMEALGGYLLGDMWKFYSEIKELSLKYPAQNAQGETHINIFGIRGFQPIKTVWDIGSVMGELDALQEQGVISADLLAERKKFTYGHGHLRKIASASLKKGSASYVVGEIDGSDAVIFRWTGKRTPEAFTPVAKSFTEWLATVLDSAAVAK